jgi:M-phase inducer tyrosine phosphatase
LLDGNYVDQCDEFHIIDCRFPYEYDGGHIASAQNIYTTNDLEALFFTGQLLPRDKKVVIVLHCEYSAQRAPRMYVILATHVRAKHMRNYDRSLNANRYPNLYYPHVYVLEGGYRKFFELYKVSA